MSVIAKVQDFKLVLAVAIAAFLPSTVAGQAADPDFWVTTSQTDVRAVARDGNIIYIGGNFTYLGPPTGKAVGIDAVSGAVTIAPKPNGIVRAIAPDGSGGWYIGGTFTKVGETDRERLAHILADGTVSPWNPGANGDVEALVLNGSTLYVGGNFSSVAATLRVRLAALDAVTGVPTAWDPGVNGRVNVMQLDGTTLYVGGQFNIIGGFVRDFIAAVDTGTGLPSAWNPSANGHVNEIALSGSLVYVGGLFTTVGGTPRNRVAALDALTGSATSWNPNPDGFVYAIALSGTSVYVGGTFQNIGGAARSRLAEINPNTGLATAWNPNPGGSVFEILQNGPTVYIGGAFGSVNSSVPRENLAEVDAVTGVATSWNPNADGAGFIYTMKRVGSTVYAGGNFTSMGGVARTRLAAIDAVTGMATAWSPIVAGTVNTIAIGPDHHVFVGTNASSGSRLHKINPVTGAIVSGTAGANNTVNTLAVSGTTVYAGGLFSTMGGQTRSRLAALNANTGAVLPWNPVSDDIVNVLTVDEGVVYVGGIFFDVGGENRHGIAALDGVTGLATPWNPNADFAVHAIEVNGSVVYAGGDFLNIGGVARTRIAALDRVSGQATPFAPQANASVRSIVASATDVYAGGLFSNIGGSSRRAVAELDPVTGMATSWNAQVGTNGPGVDGVVYALSEGGGTLLVGGEYDQIGGTGHAGVARLFTPAQETTWTSVWQADIGLYPNELCPWLVSQSGTGSSQLSNDLLTMSTLNVTDNVYYEQAAFVSIPDTLRISARVRVVSETHLDGNPRLGVAIALAMGPNAANILWLGHDTVYLFDEGLVPGPAASVDTDDALHTYDIQVVNGTAITVHQDNVPILTGSVIVYPGVPAASVYWGDITGNAFATSEWAFFRHNASTVECGAAVGAPTVGGFDGNIGAAMSLSTYPNPFRGQLTLAIRSEAAVSTSGRLKIYDVAGRMLRTLDTGPLRGGTTQVSWDARDDAGRAVSSGIYFVRLESAGKVVAMKKVTVLR